MHSSNKTEFKRWNIEVGALLSNISNPNLPILLQQAMQRTVSFKHMMIFGYRPKGRPLDLYNVSDVELRKAIVQNYISGGYLLDPFYHQYQKGFHDQFYTLSEIAPDNFLKSEYNITHYARTGIFDELVLYIDLEDSLTAALSVTRARNQPRFLKKEIQTLNFMSPVIKAFVRHYWIGGDFPESVTDALKSQTSLQEHIQYAFAQFGRSLLSNRESEVIGLILRGYSTNAISNQLGITLGTVKIHRKNAYQKLSISSQTELFSLFLKSLSDQQ